MSEEQPTSLTPHQMAILEQTIVRRVQSGDTASFGVLYDRYIDPIYRFVYYKTHQRETAEDLTADIFMKAMERIETYSDAKGGFATWLYRIARNTVVDHYRRSRPHDNIDDMWDVLPGTENLARDTDHLLLIEQVQEHLEGFTSLERDILVLRLWEDLPHRDIALIVDKSEANCKKIYSRSLQKLRLTMPAIISFFLSLGLITYS